MKSRLIAAALACTLSFGFAGCGQVSAEESTKSASSAITSILDSLKGIKDMDTAKAAVTKITDFAPKISAADTVLKGLDKTGIADALKGSMTKLDGLKGNLKSAIAGTFTKLAAQPQVLDYLKKALAALPALKSFLPGS